MRTSSLTLLISPLSLTLLLSLFSPAISRTVEGQVPDYYSEYEYRGQWKDWEDHQKEQLVEPRGEGLWRKECRRWSSEEVYLEGDKVQHGDTFYQAKWWSSGSKPGQSWGDWEVVGPTCAGLDIQPVVAEPEDDTEPEDEADTETELEDNTDITEEDTEVPEDETDIISTEEEETNEIDHEEESEHGSPSGPPTRKQAEKREAQLTNSELFAMVRRSISTMESGEVDKIKPGQASNPANVKRVEGILSGEDWEYIFPVRDSAYTYNRFLQSIAKFPAVCGDYSDGRDADKICRKALITMFAHFTQETGGHNPNGEAEEWRQGLVYLREAGCSEAGLGCGYDSACEPSTWQGRTWPCGEGAKYYGRGAKQLSYNFNYGPFSDAMFGTVDRLLKNPDEVASTWLNLASATWFYTYPQPPKPSMLHVIDGTWRPNKEDRKSKLEPGFGATIMIINGGIECGHGYEKPQATNRQKYYKKFAEYFKVDITGEELSCAHMDSFSKSGAGSLYIYWDRQWTKEFECQLVKYQTPFNALKPGDYVRCVEDQFKIKLE